MIYLLEFRTRIIKCAKWSFLSSLGEKFLDIAIDFSVDLVSHSFLETFFFVWKRSRRLRADLQTRFEFEGLNSRVFETMTIISQATAITVSSSRCKSRQIATKRTRHGFLITVLRKRNNTRRGYASNRLSRAFFRFQRGNEHRRKFVARFGYYFLRNLSFRERNHACLLSVVFCARNYRVVWKVWFFSVKMKHDFFRGCKRFTKLYIVHFGKRNDFPYNVTSLRPIVRRIV